MSNGSAISSYDAVQVTRKGGRVFVMSPVALPHIMNEAKTFGKEDIIRIERGTAYQQPIKTKDGHEAIDEIFTSEETLYENTTLAAPELVLKATLENEQTKAALSSAQEEIENLKAQLANGKSENGKSENEQAKAANTNSKNKSGK